MDSTEARQVGQQQSLRLLDPLLADVARESLLKFGVDQFRQLVFAELQLLGQHRQVQGFQGIQPVVLHQGVQPGQHRRLVDIFQGRFGIGGAHRFRHLLADAGKSQQGQGNGEERQADQDTITGDKIRSLNNGQTNPNTTTAAAMPNNTAKASNSR